MADLEKIVEQLSGLTVLEAAELVKKLEEKWGVSAAAPVAVAAAAGAAPAAAEAVEEKTEFDVVIKDPGPKKIDVIKVIRTLVNLSLTEARDLAQTADGKVLSAVGKEAAMDAKKKLEEVGFRCQVVLSETKQKGDSAKGRLFVIYSLNPTYSCTHHWEGYSGPNNRQDQGCKTARERHYIASNPRWKKLAYLLDR